MDKGQINKFELGLKFCPTSTSNLEELERDLKKFERKFRLIEKFQNQNTADDSLEKNKTKLFPERCKSDLNIFFDKLRKINSRKKQTHTTNFHINKKKKRKNILEIKIQEISNNETTNEPIDTNINKNII